MYICCVLFVSNRLPLNLYPFAKSLVPKQECNFLFLQLIALLFLPDCVQPQILQNKLLGIHILCSAMPKPSWKELNRDAWKFGGQRAVIFYLFYTIAWTEWTQFPRPAGCFVRYICSAVTVIDQRRHFPTLNQPRTFLISS